MPALLLKMMTLAFGDALALAVVVPQSLCCLSHVFVRVSCLWLQHFDLVAGTWAVFETFVLLLWLLLHKIAQAVPKVAACINGTTLVPARGGTRL